MRQFIVYMATNRVNGKRYIGVTSRGLEVRKEQHLYLARKGSKGCNRLYDAIRKYGESSFTWQVIAYAETEKQAFIIERRLIRKIRRLSEEYNVTDGGEGGRSAAPFPEEFRRRLRELGLENKERWAKYSHLGPMTLRKRVVCLNDGTVYESASAAAKSFCLSKSLVIEVCGRHPRRKTANGLVFRYFGDHLGGVEEAALVIAQRDTGRTSGAKSLSKPVECTSYGIKFGSALAASNEYCIPLARITESCRVGKTAFGLSFRYI
jgi:hypothetical protein